MKIQVNTKYQYSLGDLIHEVTVQMKNINTKYQYSKLFTHAFKFIINLCSGY